MKKKWLSVLLLLLTGCHQNAVFATREIEHNTTITITMDDEAYAKRLKALWNTTYPNQKDAIQIKIEPYLFTQQITADVIWTNDLDAPFLKNRLASFDDIKIDYEVPEHLERNELKGYYLPLRGEGTVFTYNERLLAKQGNIADLSSFEDIHKQNIKYYHNHLEDYVYPFMASLFPKEDMISKDDVFRSTTIEEQLSNYKTLYQTAGFEDDFIAQRDFYKTYPCGLLSTKYAYEKSEEYQNGYLHFTAMPTLNDQELHPPMVTFGFAITSDCKAKKTAKAFLELTRSKAGISAMIDAKVKIPVLNKDDIDDVSIYDHALKELIGALNDSVLYNQTTIRENPGVTMEKILNGSDVMAIIQNYICGNDSATTTQKKLIKEANTYILNN